MGIFKSVQTSITMLLGTSNLNPRQLNYCARPQKILPAEGPRLF